MYALLQQLNLVKCNVMNTLKRKIFMMSSVLNNSFKVNFRFPFFAIHTKKIMLAKKRKCSLFRVTADLAELNYHYFISKPYRSVRSIIII